LRSLALGFLRVIYVLKFPGHIFFFSVDYTTFDFFFVIPVSFLLPIGLPTTPFVLRRVILFFLWSPVQFPAPLGYFGSASFPLGLWKFVFLSSQRHFPTLHPSFRISVLSFFASSSGTFSAVVLISSMVFDISPPSPA